MTFAPGRVVAQNVLAMYRQPDSGSEQVSQMVMGARVQVLERREGFALILGEDRYQGWVLDRFLCEPFDTKDYLTTSIATLFCDVHTAPGNDAPLRTKLTAGANVVLDAKPTIDEYVPLLLPTKETAYTHRLHLASTYESPDQTGSWRPAETPSALKHLLLSDLFEKIAQTACRFVGTPYLWGGTTPFGLDCSGFTQLVYRLNDILLLRDAYMQYEDRRFVPVDEGRAMAGQALAPADLLFFCKENDSSGRRVTHVGLALGDGAFIHSAGGGRGNLISLCSDSYYASIYLGARRLSPDADFSIDAA